MKRRNRCIVRIRQVTEILLRPHGSGNDTFGLIRFDAFEDAGGAQSFALALVDDDGDGVVLSSLHSRPTTRVYVKAIRRGVADAPLSAEEARALQDAGITPRPDQECCQQSVDEG